MDESLSNRRRTASELALRGAAVALLLGGFVWLLAGLDSAGTPGWDETGHTFSALRMGVALRTLDGSALREEFLRPDFYTPLGRLGMSLGFLFGEGFDAPRIATAAAWFLAIGLAGILARRVAGRGAADAATFWTVLAGVTSYLGIDYSRAAFQEAWSALMTVAAVLVYLRARDRGSAPGAFACGLLLGAAVLVKYTYAIYLIGAVGLSGLWDLARRPPNVRPGRLLAGGAAGLALVLLWWFVLPLPAGPAVGREHWQSFLEYLSKAKSLSSVGPASILIYWPFKACTGLVVFGLQVAGLVWGFSRWREPGARLCSTLVLVSALGFVVYPFRIDRFLLPNLFGAWVLSGALVARAQGSLAPRIRPAVGAVLVAGAWLTAGVGARPIARFVLAREHPDVEVTEAGVDGVEREIESWRNPYRERPAPATGPPGTRQVLQVAATHLDPRRNFAWIGGTGTELPLQLLQWGLFRVHGDVRSLYPPRREEDSLMMDERFEAFDEARFRRWVSHFPQVGVLDPPDPKLRPRPFEVRFAEWMGRHPGFTQEVAAPVELEVRGEARPFEVRIYRRRGD